jgi:tetratricopeptide (TPR) repeat protein
MRAAPLLLIVTMRNDVVANWHGDPHHECIRLDRLSGAQCSRIAHAVADERLSDTALQSVARRADGIPLFAEELGRLLAQRDDVAAQVPETLSDLLMARLDALGPAKHFAQTASVLGTEFDPALFRAVAGLDEPDARSALCTLANADIVVLDGDHPTGCCTFRHAMIRDAAYGTLMKGRRRTLHRRAASVIGDHFPHLAAVQPEIPAHHWSEAEDFEHAVPAWREAARQASLKSAFAEAQQACERAIDAIDRLTETPEHEEQELEIRSIYADVLRITRGYAAPATKEAVADVKRLAERRGDLRKQCAHVAGAWMVASSGGNYPLAEKLVNQLMPLAHADGGIDELGVAYALQLTTQYRTGDLLGAEETFRIARPYFVSVEFHKRAGAAGQTYGNAALNAWLLDDQTEASSRISECLRISSGILSPYEEAFATYMAALLAVLRRSHSEARNFARQSLDLSDRNGFPQFAAISRIALGRAEAELGSPETALVLMHDGFTRMKANRSRNGLTMLLTWLAEVEAQSGNERKAIETLTEALETNPHERFFRPETLRVRAELYERCGHREKAQTDLAGAVALSKAMSARLSHARAAAIELSRKNR